MCAVSSYFHCRSALPKNQPTHVPQRRSRNVKVHENVKHDSGRKKGYTFQFPDKSRLEWFALGRTKLCTRDTAQTKDTRMENFMTAQTTLPNDPPNVVVTWFSELCRFCSYWRRDEGHGGENVSKVAWEILFGYTLKKESAREMCWKLSW